MQRWAEAQAAQVQWHVDRVSCNTMDRPAWRKVETDILAGMVAKLVVWKLSHLGLTASGLSKLFRELKRRAVGFESLDDQFDLSDPGGRHMQKVVAAVAVHEDLARAERLRAAKTVAQTSQDRREGRKTRRRNKVKSDQVETILMLRSQGRPIASISRAVCLSRPTIYDILGEFG